MESSCAIDVMNIAENLLAGSITTDQDSRLSWNDREKNPRDSVIRFAGEPESDEEGELGTEYVS